MFSRDTWQRVIFLAEYHDPGKGVKSIEKGDYLPFFLLFGAMILLSVVGYAIISFIKGLFQ